MYQSRYEVDNPYPKFRGLSQSRRSTPKVWSILKYASTVYSRFLLIHHSQIHTAFIQPNVLFTSPYDT
jgi:hypothetical protein